MADAGVFPVGQGWDALLSFLGGAPFPAMVWNEDGEIILANATLLAATGHPAESIPTLAAWSELAHGASAGISPGVPDRLAASPGHVDGGECHVRTAAGETLSWRVSEVALGTGPDGRRLFATMAHDLTERRAVEEALRERALNDRLTGLYTRRHLADQVEAAIAIADRYEQPLTLCLCDLDGFTEYGREHGHEAGDALLMRFAGILRESLRSADIPARAGGLAGRMGSDEFGIVFPYTPSAGAMLALRRVAAALGALELGTGSGSSPRITASFGVAAWRKGDDMAALFGAAAAALAEARSAGPGNFRVA